MHGGRFLLTGRRYEPTITNAIRNRLQTGANNLLYSPAGMLKILEKAYDKIKDVYGPRHFTTLLGLLVIISVAGLIIGVKYSSYIRRSPEYCNSCHLMRGTFDQWRESHHKTVTCQECHKLGLIEQNMLQVKYVLYGTKSVSQEHGKTIPWESCAECHWEQGQQGSGKPEEAFGHFRHHFVECFNCHPMANHDFPPDKDACVRCHKTKEVHGVGMEGLSCVDCHIFSMREGTEKNRVIPTKARCMGCHSADPKLSLPDNAPMASLECFECHNPHGNIKPDDALCMSCHKTDTSDRGHALHKGGCAGCHKPHIWKTSGHRALCSGCHGYRDPSVFSRKQ